MEDIIRSLNGFIQNKNKLKSGKNNKKDTKIDFLTQLATDFIHVIEKKGTNEQLQEAIKKGLDDLDRHMTLDSDEQDDLLYEIEALMDIVNLESSGGYLNEWRYGFNPNDPLFSGPSAEQRAGMLSDFHQKIEGWAEKLEASGNGDLAKGFRDIKKANK